MRPMPSPASKLRTRSIPVAASRLRSAPRPSGRSRRAPSLPAHRRIAPRLRRPRAKIVRIRPSNEPGKFLRIRRSRRQRRPRPGRCPRSTSQRLLETTRPRRRRVLRHRRKLRHQPHKTCRSRHRHLRNPRYLGQGDWAAPSVETGCLLAVEPRATLPPASCSYAPTAVATATTTAAPASGERCRRSRSWP